MASWLERLFPLVALPVVVSCLLPLGSVGGGVFWASVLGFVALFGVLSIPAWTNRVVAGPHDVRVRYLTTELEVPRSTIVAIRPRGGATSFELTEPVATVRGRVRARLPVPSSLRFGWRRLADAVGVPGDESRTQVRPVFRWLAAAVPFVLVAIVVVGSTQQHAPDDVGRTVDGAVLVSGGAAADEPQVEVTRFLQGVAASALLAAGALLLDRRRNPHPGTDGDDGFDGTPLPPIGHSLPLK
ncbi:MAG: hypothetical protein KF906_01965 [Actinobacteria bacterium]|nr:hypothetical protein [Actinomycetota bacterium]